MKSVYILVAALIAPFFSFSQSMGPEITVAENSDYGRTRPRIVLANDNIPVVMWGKNTSDKVYVSRFESNAFTTPVNVVPGDEEAFVSDWAGPDIASNGNDVFVTYHSQPEAEGFVYVVKSSDGGVTFGDTIKAESIGADQSRFPVIAVDANGNPAVMFMRFSGNWIEPEYVVANSTDGGATYNADVNAAELAPGEVCDCCPAALLSEGQRQVAMFRNNDNNLRDLWVTISNDNGADFDEGGDMDPNNWVINSCPSTGPDGYINGDSLYTVWMSAGQGASRVYMSSVHLPTATKGITWEVAPNQNSSANQNYPRIAGEGDVMGIVYQEASGGNFDCYITISTDGGNSFSTPSLLHNEADGTQRNPDVTYENGMFHVVFEDLGAGDLIYRTVSLPGLGVADSFEENEISFKQVDQTVSIVLANSGIYHVEIINSIGQAVHSITTDKRRVDFDINHSGSYICSIRSKNKLWTRKFVIKL
jgi:hypothetical protein